MSTDTEKLRIAENIIEQFVIDIDKARMKAYTTYLIDVLGATRPKGSSVDVNIFG